MILMAQAKSVPSLAEVNAAIERVVSKIDLLEPMATPELFRRHLRSVRALLRAEEARASAYAGTKSDLSAQTLELVRTIGRGFDADAGDWNAYLSGRRSMLMAYVSRRDNSLAHYWLTLPKGFDKGKAYPLYFELHGAGDPHPLGWAAGQLGLPEGMTPAGYKRPTMVPMVEGKGFHVYPYGRGNSGYEDIGETDVWEALADVEATVRLDPDRYYLYGFSMGGGGTWKIATRSPDRWAAAAIFAPAARTMDRDAKIGLAQNVANLPLWVWCGADDALVTNARRIRDESTRFGNPPEYIEVPNLGHNFTQEAQTQAARFFDGKVRHRPSRFSFVADTPEHLGAWGVRLERDPLVSFAPRFDVSIVGSTVALDSEGTSGLAVDLPALGIKGETTVIWNGREAYRGEPKSVTLGKVAPRRNP
ncbi:hypothetical protein EON82_14780 [bacterium]|nr:MAG: hypothetical protein EON82_14780 [bacterium]